MKNILFVFAGGGIGSCLRYALGLSISKWFDTKFPFATLIINISGSLFIGFLLGFFQKNNSVDNSWSLFLITGLCGGYTTFSTFSAENMALVQQGEVVPAILYMSVSLIGGIIATVAGFMLAKL